ncbi:hypothetical protein BFJ68_g3538 [Fusarium oxysporum]|uniref:Nephrocystin 3-like N-terminal domain-containing protein n=1 Tax=Fusarium oxysporum TaxID=5507 RepID=A0A420RQH6_FUSOX|nr:hypothetical protein BFJ68_g3538 [Fusarium oxysporum]
MEPRLVDNLGEVFLTSEVTDSDVCPLCWLVLRDRVPMSSDEAHGDSTSTLRSGKQLKVDKKATVTFDDDAKQASDADHHDLHHGNHDDFKIELHVANHLQYLMVLSLRLAEAMNDESSQVTGGSGSKLINECSSVDKSGINEDTFSEGGLIYLSDIELEELQKIRDANEATEIAMLAAESPSYGSDSPLSTLTVSRDNVAFDSKEYTVGWICAIPLEMDAARGMLDKIHPRLSRRDHNDHNDYILGEIHGHKIVIACLPVGEYGSSSAASVARDLLLTFESIHTCLLVGIGSGAPSPQHDIRLGDVVIGQPSATTGGVVQYDPGKSLSQDKFQPTSTHNTTPQLLITALARLEATHMTTDSRVPEFLAQLVTKSPEGMKSRFKHPETANDLLYESNYNHANPEDGTCEKCDESKICRREERQDIDPYFHYGIIASGNHIVKDGKTREFLSQQFNALCFDMEAAGMLDLPCLVIRGICDYADSHRNNMWQGYAAATAAAFAKELMLFVTPNQVLQQKKLQTDHVSIAKDNLEALMVTSNEKGYMEYVSPFVAGVSLTWSREPVNNRPIDLYTVLNARYDSEDVRNSPRCQPGTRLRILETIEQWAVQGMSQPVFWLIGPTGTGKSTIARSIVDALDKDKRLAAGYFFKRGDEDRNDTNRLFSTLAMQFADNVSSFKESLRKELEGLDKDAVDKMDLETQFQKLLLCPLENLQLDEKDHLERTIIIDALDECERPEKFLRLLELFSKLCTTSKLCLRVLITSRSTPEIVEAFESHLRNGTVHTLELHRKFAEDTKADIRKFLKTSFEDIRHRRRVQQYPWPNIEELDRSVELSTTPEPLFIYAATLCRFVSDEQRGPTRQLTIWLKQGNKSQLQQIYTPILDQAFVGFDEEEFSQKLRFLGAITLSKKPLSAKALAIILGIDLYDISWWLPRLYAVLHAPPRLDEPIELVHTSFRDFLVSSDDLGSHKYQINAAEIHANLAKGG